MNDLFDLSTLELNNTSYLDYFFGLISTSFFVLLVRMIYLKYSNTVSNKILTANLFFIFGISIFLIVVTIKSSIVLSLGLVGALSIIRFRTAIKEPEQIIYFLFITGISISTAADSFLFPLLSVITLYTYVVLIKKNHQKIHFSINDQIIIKSEPIKNKILEEGILLLNSNGVNVEVQSFRKDAKSSTIVLKVSDFDLNHVEIIEAFFREKKVLNVEIQFFSSPE